MTVKPFLESLIEQARGNIRKRYSVTGCRQQQETTVPHIAPHNEEGPFPEVPTQRFWSLLAQLMNELIVNQRNVPDDLLDLFNRLEENIRGFNVEFKNRTIPGYEQRRKTAYWGSPEPPPPYRDPRVQRS